LINFFNKGKRSLSIKTDDNEEIMKRVLRSPKWKLLCKDHLERIN